MSVTRRRQRTMRRAGLSWRLLVALLACAAPAGAQTPPVLDVAPLRLSFAGNDRAERLPAQRVDIRNTGGGDLVWEAHADAAWVLLTPGRGLAPGALQVGVDARLLRPGDYEARVLVDAPRADRSPQTILVHVTLESTQPAGPPALQAGPSRVSLAASPGQAQAVSSSLRVSAEHDAAVPFSARTDADWLAVAPGRGTTPATLTVTATPASLAIGDHAGTVLLSPAGRGPVVRVPVVISVQAPGGRLAFDTTSLPPAVVDEPYSAALAVHGGRPPYTFQLAGSLPPDLVLANGVISGAAKAPGTFEFSVIASDSAEPPVTVTQALTLLVTPPRPVGTLVVNPDRVALEAPRGGVANSIVVQITSTEGAGAWRASAGASWLRVEPDAGRGAGKVTVTADTATMKPGIYRTWITVTMPGAANGPVHVPVELVVKD